MTEIGVVLDTSALLNYARLDGVPVGELIGEVARNEGLVGIPASVLVAAFRGLTGDADAKDAKRRIIDLTLDDDSAVVVLPLAAHNWLDVVVRMSDRGSREMTELAITQCLSEVATDGRTAPIATYEPKLYAPRGLPDAYILDLSAGWDGIG